jgi:hypothetical protein
MIEAIRANAQLVMRTCQELVDFEFDYSAPSVEWLAGYIERLRAGGKLAINPPRFVEVFGCYLGEAIIASYGGAWEQDEHGWHVAFDEKNKAYPFAKVEKQIQNGLEDSVFRFYSCLPMVFPHLSSRR